MAPESILGEHAGDGSAVDVYAFGMVMYAMWSGRHPYDSTEIAPFRLMARIAAGDRPAIVDGRARMPRALRELVESAWAADPGARPPVAEVVAALQELRRGLAARGDMSPIPEAENPSLLECG